MAKKNSKKPVVLGEFEGKEVVEISIALRSAGDGLSKALEIEPREMHIGDIVDVLARCRISDINHREVKDSTQLERTIVFRPGTVTIVDRDISDKMIEEQENKLDQAEAERTGQNKIPTEPWDTVTGDDGGPAPAPGGDV